MKERKDEKIGKDRKGHKGKERMGRRRKEDKEKGIKTKKGE